MEYGQRHALERDEISERTTMTTRSVRDILAEQGQAHLLDTANFVPASEAPTVPPRPMYGAATAASAAERGGVQRPPHMHCLVRPTTSDAAALACGSETQMAPRSFLSRLIGR